MSAYHWMKAAAIFDKLSLSRKTFLAMVTLVVLPVLLIAGGTFTLARANLVREVSESNLDVLRQTRTAVEKILSATEHLSYQIFRNADFRELLNREIELSNFEHIERLLRAQDLIDSALDGIPYIKSIAAYDARNNLLLTTGQSERRKLQATEIESLKAAWNGSTSAYWLSPGDPFIVEMDADSIRLVRFFSPNFRGPPNFILISLVSEEFADLIGEIYLRDSGYLHVSDVSGRLILTRSGLLDPASFASELAGSAGEGYFSRRIRQTEYLVSYAVSPYNGWTYLAVVPAAEVLRRIDLLSAVVLVLTGVVVFAATATAFGFSRALVRPILAIGELLTGGSVGRNGLESRSDELGRINRGIVALLEKLNEAGMRAALEREENQRLRERIELNVVGLRNAFFSGILFGDAGDETELLSQARSLGLPSEGPFAIALVEIDPLTFSALEDAARRDFARRARDSVQATLEPATETLKVFFETPLRLVAVVRVFAAGTASAEDALADASSRLPSRIKEATGISAAVAVGSAVLRLSSLRSSYEDAAEALRYRFVLGYDLFLSRRELFSRSAVNDRFSGYVPRLRNALEAGTEAECRAILEEFLRDSVEAGLEEGTGRYLSKTIIQAFMEATGASPELRSALRDFESRFATMGDFVSWAAAQAAVLTRDRATRAEPNRIVLQALQIIDREYGQDLGLEAIAERLNLSPAYLSRLMAAEVGVNFKEYLTRRRLEAAKALLVDSAHQVKEVASFVGYNNVKQFIRIFKKYEGITPAEFRSARLRSDGTAASS